MWICPKCNASHLNPESCAEHEKSCSKPEKDLLEGWQGTKIDGTPFSKQNQAPMSVVHEAWKIKISKTNSST